jgi:Cu/Ag efflux pump CusA
MLAVDDGIINGNITLADLFFLIAVILFLVVAFIRRATIPDVLLPLGLAAAALGWLVL